VFDPGVAVRPVKETPSCRGTIILRTNDPIGESFIMITMERDYLIVMRRYFATEVFIVDPVDIERSAEFERKLQDTSSPGQMKVF